MSAASITLAIEALEDAKRLLAHAGCPVDWMDTPLATLRAAQAPEPQPDLKALLKEAREALAGGLWDYGPGQDEHERCDEVIARIDASLTNQEQA